VNPALENVVAKIKEVVEGRPRAPSERGFVRVSQEKAPSWRHEVVSVKGRSQDRYRDLKKGRFIKKP
jgi:hypothetical protein